MIFDYLVSKKEILELDNPFGCGIDPLFTYPFFGEDQTVSLQIPSGIDDSILDALEIVLCIETGLESFNSSPRPLCYLGVSEEKILSPARQVIEEKLLELMGFEIEFIHSWREYQKLIEGCKNGNLEGLEKISDGFVELKTPLKGIQIQIYEKIQILLPFFIEAATSINSSDPKWSIYLSIASASTDDKSLVVRGLLTTYKYFRFPEGSRVRISQVLVFPRYQGHRLGTNLYRQVAKHLRECEAVDCAEICVEDPTDAFERLRSLVDYENAINILKCDKGDFKIVDEVDNLNDNNLMDNRIISLLEKELKLSKQQAERISLLHQSIQLGPPAPKKIKTASSLSLSPSDLLRQNVKRWLMRKYRKDLPEDSGEKIRKLAELYEAELEEFIEPLTDLLSK